MTTHHAEPAAALEYELFLDLLSDGYDGETCWFHPRAGAMPGRGSQPGTVVLTMQKFLLARSDCFFPVHSQWTADGGKSWSPLVEHAATLGRHTLPDGVMEGICDFTPKWHKATGKLIGTGHSVLYYPDNAVVKDRRRFPIWSAYEPQSQTWSHWQPMPLPDDPMFWNAGAGSTQRVDLDNGDMLVPLYSKFQGENPYFSAVVRYRFEDGKPQFIECGAPLFLDVKRGFGEPSLTRFGDRFYLTLRNDLAAYYAVSADGLNFSEPRKWTFDDGEELGSYNTQAHWVTHSDALFLTYTRRGANNDHVMRHRAPLFIARVGIEPGAGAGEPEKLVVLRATERELAPNKGAQLGNFAVVDVSEQETWVTTSEGMAPGEPQKFGSNGRVYATRIVWDKPNIAWDQH